MSPRDTNSASRIATAVLGAILMLTASSGARAQTSEVAEGSPSAFVHEMANHAFTILRDENLSVEERDLAFRSVFLDGFDVPRIAKSVLGRHWRRATDEQRTEYQDLFQNYIVATYSSRLGEFSGYFLRVKAERLFNKGRSVVASEIVRPDGGEPFRVDWGLRENDGAFKIVDVKIEGISMTIAQREEFAAVITNNGNQIEALLEILRDRVDAWRSGDRAEETAALVDEPDAD